MALVMRNPSQIHRRISVACGIMRSKHGRAKAAQPEPCEIPFPRRDDTLLVEQGPLFPIEF